MTANANRTKVDMLNEPLLSKIILFALPVALSGLLQQLFNAADTAVVGRFAEAGSLAAVSGNSFVINLMINLFLGISVGTNVQMASAHAQKNEDGMKKTLHTSLLFALISGLFLMVIGYFIAPKAHEWLGTGTVRADDGSVSINTFVLDQAIMYFRIYFLGMPFIMVYNFASAVLRSKGDTRRPLIILAISGVLNVILNVILVKSCGMNADGVAIATVVSNVFSCCVVLGFLKKEEKGYRLDFKALHIDGKALAGILKIGLPAGIQTSMFSIANVLLQSSINALGTDYVSATGVGIYAEYFGMNIITGFNQAATTFVGQNYAAGNLDRCRKITRITLACGAFLTFAFCGLVALLREPFVSIFLDVNRDRSIADIAVSRILLVGFFQCFNGIGEIFSGSMRGMKYSLVPALISVLAICGVRLVWVFFFHHVKDGYTHLVFCYRLSWYISAACMSVAYLLVRQKAEHSAHRNI